MTITFSESSPLQAHLMGWELIPLLIFLLAAGFGDTHNPSNASLPIWLDRGKFPAPKFSKQPFPVQESLSAKIYISA